MRQNAWRPVWEPTAEEIAEKESRQAEIQARWTDEERERKRVVKESNTVEIQTCITRTLDGSSMRPRGTKS